MSQSIHLHYDVPGDDFTRAGEASGMVKNRLKKLGFPSEVIHANGGAAEIDIAPDRIDIQLIDHGPGIPDVEKAMQEGWSTAPDNVRSLGFGAGMGLPNIKKYTDQMNIDTEIGKGTTVSMTVFVPGK